MFIFWKWESLQGETVFYIPNEIDNGQLPCYILKTGKREELVYLPNIQSPILLLYSFDYQDNVQASLPIPSTLALLMLVYRLQSV